MSAFAFNKPVIATNVGGLPEMVIHQQYGLIIKEKNVNAIVESMTLLWRQQDVINTYSEHIKQDYDTGELSWKKIAEEIRSKYAIIIQ
jgi:glycosyltransferase involved in cell wall biosynthesis